MDWSVHLHTLGVFLSQVVNKIPGGNIMLELEDFLELLSIISFGGKRYV